MWYLIGAFGSIFAGGSFLIVSVWAGWLAIEMNEPAVIHFAPAVICLLLSVCWAWLGILMILHRLQRGRDEIIDQIIEDEDNDQERLEQAIQKIGDHDSQ